MWYFVWYDGRFDSIPWKSGFNQYKKYQWDSLFSICKSVSLEEPVCSFLLWHCKAPTVVHMFMPVTSIQYRLSHVNPSAVQNSKNVRTVFRRRPSKKIRKKFQKSGLSYHVLEPFTPRRKKYSKSNASVHHSNMVYINSSLSGSGSTESHVDNVEGQIGTSTMDHPRSIAVREASQALPTAKTEVQALPTVDKTHMQL